MINHVTYRQGAVTTHLSSVAEVLAYVTASVSDGFADAARACEEAYEHITHLFKRERMQIVHERIFGNLRVRAPVMDARRAAIRQSGISDEWPVTYVQGRPPCGEGLSGISIQAVRPRQAGDVWTIYEDELPCGRGWRRNGATFLMLQDLHGLRKGRGQDNSREAQVARMFDRASRILRRQDAAYCDVARTWIYISDILDWYGEFNLARSAKYGQLGLTPDPSARGGTRGAFLPASTGIQGENPHGAACVMDLLAVSGKPGDRPEVTPMTNVRQKDAFEYGSAFSRGVCIRESGLSHIQVSGTAAIDEQGKSLFPGDCRAQILYTIDTIEALIAQEGASLRDICEATVFLKHAEDTSVFKQVAAARGLAEIPAVNVLADICREDLLFEMDGAAVLQPR